MIYKLKECYLPLVDKLSRLYTLTGGDIEIAFEISMITLWFPTEDENEIGKRAVGTYECSWNI